MQNSTKLNAQHLLIDADDTLWENNIYFERAITNLRLLGRFFPTWWYVEF